MVEWLFWVLLIGAIVWTAYMATFRTDQWVAIQDMNQRHKQSRREGWGRIGGSILRALFGK